MQKIIAVTIAVITILISSPEKTNTNEEKTYLNDSIKVKTDTKFSQKEFTETKDLPFEIKYKNDPDTEFGTTKTLEEGKNGAEIKTYKITFYNNEEVGKELANTDVTPPKDQVDAKGTKIVWKTGSGNRCGDFKYWHKYEKVYMTTYTPQCEGCDAWTSIGLKAGYGIIAVDPKKIPYYTKVCIPGYGIAIAGDTGGAMRSYSGLLIDLGFPSLSPADKWMNTGRYDMYILNNENLYEKFFVGDIK